MYELRQATEDDFDFLYRLHVATMKEYVAAVYGWDDAFQERYFKEKFDPTSCQIVVVEGRDVGMVRVDESEGELYIDNIHILPEYQNRGLGTAILEDILRSAKERGLPVALRVLKGNPAKRLYERLGFAAVEETETHTRMRLHVGGTGESAKTKHRGETQT